MILFAVSLNIVRGQQQYVDDNGEVNFADLKTSNDEVTESEYDEDYEENESTTTTTTTTTTPRPRVSKIRQRAPLHNRKQNINNNQIADDESSNIDARKSRPAFTVASRNAINDQDRAESRTQERIVDDEGSYFSRRYARFLFRQRSG